MGKNLVEPVTDTEEDDDDDAFFLDQHFSGIFDKDIQDSLECYLKFSESENPEQNPLNHHFIQEK